MTVRAKIMGGFLIIFTVGLVLGIIGFISTSLLTGMSGELYALQSQSGGVANVLNAHYIWRQGLTEAVLKGSEFTGSLDPTACALGKWRNSEDAQKVDDSEILSLLSQVDAPHSYIHNEAKTLVSLIESGNTEEAKRVLVDHILPKTEETIQILTAMSARYDTLTSEKSAAIVEAGNVARIIVIILLLVAAVSCILFSRKVIVSIMTPLRSLTQAAVAIADGDLDVEVKYDVNDQIGELAKSFQNIVDSTKAQVEIAQALANGDLAVSISARSEKDVMNISMEKMINNLNSMFGQINSATSQVASGSKQIADGSQTLAQGSTEQAAAVEELSSSISEIADKTKENSGMADKAAQLAETIKQNAEKGNSQMSDMIVAVQEINQASQSIGNVIKVIDDIAFQTNILALNAAVEAARAAQHGKGFAVVAEEVRNLAAKSAEAAKETESLIANSIAKAELGATIANRTAESLNEIVAGINDSGVIVAEIARSSREQSGAIAQINQGIEQVAQVVQQNSATAEESAAASEQMSSQSDILQDLVAQFKLK